MTFRVFAAPLALSFAAMVSAQQPATTRAADFSTMPVSAGLWTYQAVPGGSSARCIDASGTARFALECSKATRRITLARTSATPAASLFLWASDASRMLAARFEPNAMRVSADLLARDPLLDAIAISRGRIAVTMAGAEPLIMPAWPETARTIEDCRI
jgi:hypothetical protein